MDTSRSAGAREASRSHPRTGLMARVGAAAAAAGLLVGLSACGFNAQTLKTYTPADGVNVNVGNPNGQMENGQSKIPTSSAVKVRGLMILAESPTSGFLSATVISDNPDQLTDITGNVLEPDGSQGPALTIQLPSPITLNPHSPVILVDRQAVTVTGSQVPAGATASLKLTFAKAGSTQVTVPIVDGQNDTYRTVSPSPAPSSSSTSGPIS